MKTLNTNTQTELNNIKENTKNLRDLLSDYINTIDNIEELEADLLAYYETEMEEEIIKWEEVNAGVECYYNGDIYVYAGHGEGIHTDLIGALDVMEWVEEEDKMGIKEVEYEGFKYSPRITVSNNSIETIEIEEDLYYITKNEDISRLEECYEIGDEEDKNEIIEKMEEYAKNDDYREYLFLNSFLDIHLFSYEKGGLLAGEYLEGRDNEY